jgi:hypothetical protein
MFNNLCLDYSLTLKMDATRSPETSAGFCQITRRYNTEGGTFHTHRCENLKFYTSLLSYFRKLLTG